MLVDPGFAAPISFPILSFVFVGRQWVGHIVRRLIYGVQVIFCVTKKEGKSGILDERPRKFPSAILKDSLWGLRVA